MSMEILDENDELNKKKKVILTRHMKSLKRENEIIKERTKESKLNKIFIKKLYALIFNELRRIQK